MGQGYTLARMSGQLYSRMAPIATMADGTVKQINPFSGTEVWTVPGRGHRPLGNHAPEPTPLTPEAHRNTCAFCSDRMRETPPEKARMTNGVISAPGPEALEAPADFRRVPNLFEIVSYESWQKNYGYQMPRAARDRMERYIASAEGREHVLDITKTKRRAAGLAPSSEQELLVQAEAFFGGGHDLIVGRKHYIDGATTSDQLASSGTLTPQEHADLIRFTVATAKDLYASNPYAVYVAIFQNWLRPAGASFDHLHKQLVSIDEQGNALRNEIDMLRANPNMYNEWAVDYAGSQNLIIAENDHAVCFAGFGHRYPTLEVFSKSPIPEPWLQSDEEIRAMSDLLHACHAAAGASVPCNEEWHHKPVNLDIPMPWRILIKWRVSTLAGFEGGTKVYLNTLSPWNVRDRVVSELYRLRDEGSIASFRIAEECTVARNSLRYNPLLTMRPRHSSS